MALFGFFLFLTTCGTKDAQGVQLELVQHHAWPPMTDSFDGPSLSRAILWQREWLNENPDYHWSNGDVVVDAQRLDQTLMRLEELWRQHGAGQALTSALQKEFLLYRVIVDGSKDTLFTGYYSPVFQGRLQEDDTFRFPLYAVPDDMVWIDTDSFNPRMLQKGPGPKSGKIPARLENDRVVAYYTRAQIDDEGVLRGRGLELVYLADYFQAFTFQVQGGGFLQLADGSYLKLNYAGKNGHPYTSIGRILIEEGHIPKAEISMQAIGDYFAAHPEDVTRVCNFNTGYVFYQADGVSKPALEPEMFPHGFLGFPVTAKRSIATDKRLFAGGLPGFIRGSQRLADGGVRSFSAFVVDQDTGGAIRNNHLDFYLGAGDGPGEDAGRLNDTQGEWYILLLRVQPAS